MKILLDTHILIWFHTKDSSLSEKAWSILLNPENEIFYSSVNVWETQIKYLKHKDEINFSGENMLFMIHDSLIPFYNEPCILSV